MTAPDPHLVPAAVVHHLEALTAHELTGCIVQGRDVISFCSCGRAFLAHTLPAADNALRVHRAVETGIPMTSWVSEL